MSSHHVLYTPGMPRLWKATIEEHRREVHAAVLDTTAALVAEHGLLAVTMSRIAEQTGIGRATLYKYFPDVETILRAWHQRQIAEHLAQLTAARDASSDPAERLTAVLQAFALISHRAHSHQDSELSAGLHRDHQVTQAEQQVQGLLADLLADAARAGVVRDDLAPAEQAAFCLHALTAARSLPSRAATRRLVQMTLAGLRSP